MRQGDSFWSNGSWK